jgi:hypothetical protein
MNAAAFAAARPRRKAVPARCAPPTPSARTVRGNPTQAGDRCAADSPLCHPRRVPAAARALLAPCARRPPRRPHPAPLPPALAAAPPAPGKPRVAATAPASAPPCPAPDRRPRRPPKPAVAPNVPRVPRPRPEPTPRAERRPPPGSRAVFTAVRPRHRARPRRPRPAETHPARRVAACPLGGKPARAVGFRALLHGSVQGGGGLKSFENRGPETAAPSRVNFREIADRGYQPPKTQKSPKFWREVMPS